MARFDVYRHPDAALRKRTPYLLDVQNDHINGLETRVVVPIRAARQFGLPMRDLNPLLEVDGTQAVLDAAALAAFPASDLRNPVANLRAQADVIVNALDTLFGSY
ncbi:MAG: plasmid maintenance protein CcdB [Comamonadaceae bacterium]|nr:MAG: plasmid maintenance protein CcdB [Comamonadaceae bacterium]